MPVSHSDETALGHEPGARAAFFGQAGADDADLRREVKVLQARVVQQQQIVDQPVGNSGRPSSTNAVVSRAARAVGAYRVEALRGPRSIGEVNPDDKKIDLCEVRLAAS